MLVLPGCPETIDLTTAGNRGYDNDTFSDLSPGTRVDATGASWVVANSSMEDEIGAWCKDPDGKRPQNRYPLRVYRSPSVTLTGVLVAGEVPQLMSWGATYCNSAAIAIIDSPDATVSNVRIDAAWDAVRYTERHGSTEDHHTEHLWVTRNRDDCVEADAKNNATVEDVLCESFVGISAASWGVSRPENTMTLKGVLLSVLEYDYRGRPQMGPPIKLNEKVAVGLNIADSVIVLNSHSIVESGTFHRIRASMRKCENNLLIWPFDTELPDFVDVPDCFSIVAGTEGAARWQKIRQNWIDCHPDVPRLPEDPESRPEHCIRDEYGGMY